MSDENEFSIWPNSENPREYYGHIKRIEQWCEYIYIFAIKLYI